MERTLGKGSYTDQCDHVVTIGHFQSCTKSDSKQWGLQPQAMAALQLSEAATSGGRNGSYIISVVPGPSPKQMLKTQG